VDRRVEDCTLQPLRLSLDPGSKVTGLCLARVETQTDAQPVSVLMRGDGYSYNPVAQLSETQGDAPRRALSLPPLKERVSRASL
jgi:hypothetical protein